MLILNGLERLFFHVHVTAQSSLVNVYNGVRQRINFPMIFTYNSFCNESTVKIERGFERELSYERNVHYYGNGLGTRLSALLDVSKH